ncbi:MAG: serine hydrolase, partial [Bacteroidetes bacterium]|nr:serine hydrolase [Fibrella sp.]
DPDPTRTRLIETALKAMDRGGNVLSETPGISPGTKKDFATGGGNLTANATITFLKAENVAGRGIERHEGRVDQILHYKLAVGKTPRYVIVHLTPDGLVTDYDVVEK